MGQSEPELRIRTLALVVLPLVASPLASKFRVPRSVQPPHGKLRPPLMPDAAPPVNRYRRSLSRSNNNSAVLAIVYILSTLHQWFPCGPLLACHLTWLFQAFSFRVHDRGFWPKPPKVVWSLLLQADSEGPSLISQTVAHLLSPSAVCCARGTLMWVNRKLNVLLFALRHFTSTRLPGHLNFGHFELHCVV